MADIYDVIIIGTGAGGGTLAARLAATLGHGHRVATVTPAADPVRGLFATRQEMDWIETADPVAWIAQNRRAGDLLLFVGIDAAREALAHVPALEGERFLVAQAAAKLPAERPEPVTGPVVVGRSLKPSHA